VIILKDIKYQELSGIVEFIYHGEVSIDQDCLPGFLQAAESLRIKGLTEDKKVSLYINQKIQYHNNITIPTTLWWETIIIYLRSLFVINKPE